MARRSDHSREELKELMLERSWEIVGERGLEGLTARHVAREIGYAPGTIYNLFESMDDLYLQVNARTLDMLYGLLSGAECNDPGASPEENMKKMAVLYMNFARQYRPYWLMLFNLTLADASRIRQWYQQKIDRLFIPLENLLTPLFPPGDDRRRKMAARVLWSSVHGLCFLQETGKIPLIAECETPGEMVTYLVETFVAGIKR